MVLALVVVGHPQVNEPEQAVTNDVRVVVEAGEEVRNRPRCLWREGRRTGTREVVVEDALPEQK